MNEPVTAPLNLSFECDLIGVKLFVPTKRNARVSSAESETEMSVMRPVECQFLVFVDEDRGGSAESVLIGDPFRDEIGLVSTQDIILVSRSTFQMPVRSNLYDSGLGMIKTERSVPELSGSRYSFVQASFSVRQIVSR